MLRHYVTFRCCAIPSQCLSLLRGAIAVRCGPFPCCCRAALSRPVPLRCPSLPLPRKALLNYAVPMLCLATSRFSLAGPCIALAPPCCDRDRFAVAPPRSASRCYAVAIPRLARPLLPRTLLMLRKASHSHCPATHFYCSVALVHAMPLPRLSKHFRCGAMLIFAAAGLSLTMLSHNCAVPCHAPAMLSMLCHCGPRIASPFQFFAMPSRCHARQRRTMPLPRDPCHAAA